jgi:hypothetical protein
LLDQFPIPASPSESAPSPARIADPNELNFANHNSPHYPILATGRDAELKGVYEVLMTDNRTRRQLHIEGCFADEKHRQMEVGGQRGDAQAAVAAAKLERFHGRWTKRSRSGAKTKAKSKPFARHTEHFPLASAIGYRLSEKWQSRLGRWVRCFPPGGQSPSTRFRRSIPR